jgi:hypothetical protein
MSEVFMIIFFMGCAAGAGALYYALKRGWIHVYPDK